MGYRVQYPGGHPKVKKSFGGRKRGRTILSVLLIALLFGSSIIPVTRKMLLDVIMPGDPAVTVAALECLVQDMKQGEAIDDAITVFYDTVRSGR